MLADPAGNAGGGAPFDNTTILRRLLDRGVERAAVGPVWDPIGVKLCFDAGENARFPLRFGGKIGPASGQPIDAVMQVVALKRDRWQSFGPTQVPLGDCAAIWVAGVEVVLIEKRTHALSFELSQPRYRSTRPQNLPRQFQQPFYGDLRLGRTQSFLRQRRRTAR